MDASYCVNAVNFNSGILRGIDKVCHKFQGRDDPLIIHPRRAQDGNPPAGPVFLFIARDRNRTIVHFRARHFVADINLNFLLQIAVDNLQDLLFFLKRLEDVPDLF